MRLSEYNQLSVSQDPPLVCMGKGQSSWAIVCARPFANSVQTSPSAVFQMLDTIYMFLIHSHLLIIYSNFLVNFFNFLSFGS